VAVVIREEAPVVSEVGAPFEVELDSAPTTGYGWEIAHLPPGVDLLGSDFTASPDGEAGDGGVQVFRLVANHPGHYELRFLLKRRWEQEPIDLKVVEVESVAKE
jgi:predicted secreted protein